MSRFSKKLWDKIFLVLSVIFVFTSIIMGEYYETLLWIIIAATQAELYRVKYDNNKINELP